MALKAGRQKPEVHPVASLHDIFRPRRLKSARALLETPGLELTYNGRGALLRACQEIALSGRRKILMPAFHCPSGVTPALFAGLEPVFYRIRRDLSIDHADLNTKADQETGGVLVIHFFGMKVDLAPLQGLRERGIRLIEDWSHSFLQGSPPALVEIEGDYGIFSFWKLIPSSVGGGLWRRAPAMVPGAQAPLPPVDERIVLLKRMLEESLARSDHSWAWMVFQKLERLRLAMKPRRTEAQTGAGNGMRGEDHYPFDARLAACTMPPLARQIIECADLAAIARLRRANYGRYAEQLSECPELTCLFPVLPETACPWVFPLLLPRRDDIDHHWLDSGVALHTFGLHLHSALFSSGDARTISDAVFLSRHVLCLSVHQNITRQDIDRSLAVIAHSLDIP